MIGDPVFFLTLHPDSMDCPSETCGERYASLFLRDTRAGPEMRSSVETMSTSLATAKRTKRDESNCDIYHVDGEKVRRVLRRAGSNGRFETLARMFQVLSDPTRAKLLFALAGGTLRL